MHWEDLEGSGEEGGGRGDRDGEHENPWLIHVNVWQNPLQYCKVISLQIIKTNENKKVGLKLNIQKTKIMASGSITSWQIDGEIVETVSDFIFGGSKITADGD